MSSPKREVRKRSKPDVPSGYAAVLADVKRLIAESRHRALATVSRELVALYWRIGHIIVQQQEQAKRGDAVVEQLSADLRAAFPDMQGFSRDNVFRMRQLYLGYLEIDHWLQHESSGEKVGTVSRQISIGRVPGEKVGTVSRQLRAHLEDRVSLSEAPSSPEVATLIQRLSWYQTALPDEKLIRQRLRQLPAPTEVRNG